MTATVALRSNHLLKKRPTIHYQVAMPQPQSHLFEVTLFVEDWHQPILDLKMPVWTPGSYLVREYTKHLQDFHAASGQGQLLPWRKLAKNHWQIETVGASEIAINYRIFANELTVRTNHLDATHGYFNGAALFLFIEGHQQQPIQIKIAPPHQEWRITTPLPKIPGESNSFLATDFDTLVDSPFEIGCQHLYEFEVLGIPHQLAIWGKGNANPKRIIEDIKKIIEVEAKLYGGLPYEKYLFLLHLTANKFGGLEHKNACSLIYPRFNFRTKNNYNRFLQLVAHEFFHLWNVKRIRPKALEVFDYERENYTSSLWFCEGTTSYYDLLIPLRAKIYDAKTFLEALSKEISKFKNTPGRKVQPLSESSFDAWIKLYRRDANSDNSQISYYLKGEMVSLLLDLLIRARYSNKRSLDDVMRQMWRQFGKEEIGYTPKQLRRVIELVVGRDLSNFFENYINGTVELPFNEYLEPFGLQLISFEDNEPVPFLGMITQTDNSQELIKFVEAGSPAELAGIDAGDQLLAIDGLRVAAGQLSDRLKDYNPGDTIELSIFHRDQLCTLAVTLAQPKPSCYKIVQLKNQTEVQKHNLAGWLESLGAALGQ